MKKSIFTIISLILLSSFSVFAKANNSISIQIIQNNPGHEKVWATSELFEQSIINYFFDSGKIVSNSPIYIKDKSEDKNKKALRAALIENSDGGMEYLVRVELIYKNSNSAVPDMPKLGNIQKVEWKIYKVSNSSEIASGEKKPIKVTSSNDNELGIDEFAALVAKSLSSSL